MADPQAQGEEFLDLANLRKRFEDYISLKQPEIEEQRQARRYYHGDQWTKSQLEELKKRGQPPTTTAVLARKINGFVGLVERLRQDPKAYARTPKEDGSAELCTAALRYVLDEQEWTAKSPAVTLNGAVDSIGGIEIFLTPGDSGQPNDFDIGFDYVEPDNFFYDPRSFRGDFSDADDMGISKWMPLDKLKRQFPDRAEELDGMVSGGDEFTILSDREFKWTNSQRRQIRVVEHWYRVGDQWLWCFYTSSLKLDEGRTFLFDEKGRDLCRFVMWSAFVDHDGDRYSFHRNMRSMVDEINQRTSKALHLLAMRRVKLQEGAVQDVEKLRREAVRPDGVIVYQQGFDLEFEDAKTLADMEGQLKMKEFARAELENFGPNPALVGQGVQAKSGRAIALLQEAGIAELGPFIISYRGWKIRAYRALWAAIRRYWTAERWIRVTDPEGVPQPIQINATQVDPMTGMAQMVNQIGALDVDIIIDEGPDAVNMQADALEVLQTAMQNGAQVPPEVMIELLPLPESMKKKLLGSLQKAQQPQPAQIQAQQIELAQGAAKVKETEASAVLKLAQAGQAQMPQGGEAGPTPLDAIETEARVGEIRANTVLKLTQAEKTAMETRLAPAQMAQRAASDASRAREMRS